VKAGIGAHKIAHLGDDVAQDHAGELADKAQFFGGGNEDIGPDVVPIFVRPSGQRFRAQHPAGFHVYDRLVDDCDQVAPERAPELRGQVALARLQQQGACQSQSGEAAEEDKSANQGAVYLPRIGETDSGDHAGREVR